MDKSHQHVKVEIYVKRTTALFLHIPMISFRLNLEDLNQSQFLALTSSQASMILMMLEERRWIPGRERNFGVW